MTKILFSNAPWWVKQGDELRIGIRCGSRWPFTRHTVHEPDNFRFGGYLPVPFFLFSAASYAARELPEAKVDVRDSIARGESYNTFLDYLDMNRPDWLVIESATPCWEHDQGLIGLIKAHFPEIKIIVCGTIVAGADFKKPESVYAACKGEYEKSVVRVVKEHGYLVHLAPMDFDLLTHEEMNALPYPMFDEACAFNYADGCPKGQRFPQLQVFTSRGCFYKCVWCGWPATMTGNDPDGTKARRVRGHTPEWLEGMLRDRLAKGEAAGNPYQCIYLDDDTFNLSDKHSLAISDVMGRIGLPWSAMCRADTVKRETWQAMRNAGCFGVKIGFESGSQRVIDQIINKKLNLLEAAETARYLRKIGMTVHGTFTKGMPGETEAEQKMTDDFINELYTTGAIDSHQLSATAVIEGSPMANMLHSHAALPKYPGANPDNYQALVDGQLGIEQKRALPPAAAFTD